MNHHKEMKNQEQYETEIYRYCEIVYHLLQANPELYDTLLPKSTFKLLKVHVKEISDEQTLKIAA
ncbi:MAG: hypothetical protein JNM95_05245 [Chitinophagaceae bacterium]|nr:hypothetical protein [Chitinophagaceae bacterium]